MGLLDHYKAAPLPSSFFLTSILGVLITAYYWAKLGDDWATAFILVFAMMFVASLISMRKAPIQAQLEMDHHTARKKIKKKK